MKGKKKKKEIIKEQNMVEKEAELDNEKDWSEAAEVI